MERRRAAEDAEEKRGWFDSTPEKKRRAAEDAEKRGLPALLPSASSAALFSSHFEELNPPPFPSASSAALRRSVSRVAPACGLVCRAMMVRWQLLQIADSAFPTGGFAHSGGLEAAVHHGCARTAEELGTYVGGHLWNVGWASLPFVTAAFESPGDVWALDAWNDAAMTNHVA